MKTIYVYLADGFEEIEAIAVIDVLRRANFNVCTISVSNKNEVKGAHNITVMADCQFAQADTKQADMLLLPGGVGVEILDAHLQLKKQLQDFSEANKPISAICAAPMIFGKLGLLKGKKATCYPGYEKYLAGAEITGERVVVDGNIITSKGPGTAIEFALAIVEFFAGKELSQKLSNGMCITK